MIKFKNINLRFDDKVIFENFNMDVMDGEKILLKSPSGKGKSTLLKLLLGFHKINSGEILFDSRKLEKNNLVYFRTNIAYLSQDVELRNQNIWDLIVEVFSYKHNKNIKITKEKFLDVANYFDLPKDIIKKEARELSGGERQRLGLVICILLDRKVWLLDEVTSGLDKDMKQRVVDYVLKLDKTVLIVSHDNIWSENNIVRIEEW
ncbi:ABC transporter ATP-binding protein [Tepidibacter aestuarii]|uniref:ABC transporter ATP-binding protein n=1 Tax=Tepidibacter aestuarii TaxID=2925782 RepID=UPI0020C04E46|nr:ATP-binding cassette domain-containing protein [Tepidibacter aestuarii]CAH2212172.1 putative ABC transport system ATP-binding protein [Tepidibacter aestuarii]